MAQEMAVGETGRQKLAASVLPAKEWGNYLNQSSDRAGFEQLAFHGGCAGVAALCIYAARANDAIGALIVAEMMLGFVSSFYFMGFHELIHNTAFATKSLNKVFSHIVGFFVFRGANWFWCFHWLHHRYTQDPEKDPEISGGSSDLFDPTKSVLAYCRFLTGWPFGFERTLGMAKMALGKRTDAWVISAGLEKTVQIEAAVYTLGYIAFAVASVLNAHVREGVIFYWLIPHMLGAGHLRFYQFAEHRACETGTSTDLDAWGSTRTTATWWLYRRLAWNMPFHIEHHAWPAVPFHLLPDVHERIKDNQPESRCLIKGKGGYIAIHLDFIKRVWNKDDTSPPPVPHEEVVHKEVEAGETVQDIAQGLARFTMPEVMRHKTKEDCWVVVNDMVFDVTSFLADHPGGEMVLVNKAGLDATKMFNMIHPAGTLDRHLPKECIQGMLASAAPGGSSTKVDLKEPLLPK